MLGLQIALVAVFAFAGYQEAQRFARQTGRTPWGWSPWGWAVVLGLSFLIGIVLLAVAERQGRARARRTPVFTPANYPPQPPPGSYSPDTASYAPPPTPGRYAADTTVLPNL